MAMAPVCIFPTDTDKKLVPIEFLPWKDADWRQFMLDYPWNEGNRYHRLRRAGTRPDEIACAALAYIRA